MIELKGSFTKGKALMKRKRADAAKEITKIEKKKKENNGFLDGTDIKKLERLQKQTLIYTVSKTIPACYGKVVINVKVLKAFIKKLKGLKYEIQTEDDVLQVLYGKRHGEWTGKLELYDLSNYFTDFVDVPEVIVPQEQTAMEEFPFLQ